MANRAVVVKNTEASSADVRCRLAIQ